MDSMANSGRELMLFTKAEAITDHNIDFNIDFSIDLDTTAYKVDLNDIGDRPPMWAAWCMVSRSSPYPDEPKTIDMPFSPYRGRTLAPCDAGRLGVCKRHGVLQGSLNEVSTNGTTFGYDLDNRDISDSSSFELHGKQIVNGQRAMAISREHSRDLWNGAAVEGFDLARKVPFIVRYKATVLHKASLATATLGSQTPNSCVISFHMPKIAIQDDWALLYTLEERHRGARAHRVALAMKEENDYISGGKYKRLTLMGLPAEIHMRILELFFRNWKMKHRGEWDEGRPEPAQKLSTWCKGEVGEQPLAILQTARLLYSEGLNMFQRNALFSSKFQPFTPAGAVNGIQIVQWNLAYAKPWANVKRWLLNVVLPDQVVHPHSDDIFPWLSDSSIEQNLPDHITNHIMKSAFMDGNTLNELILNFGKYSKLLPLSIEKLSRQLVMKGLIPLAGKIKKMTIVGDLPLQLKEYAAMMEIIVQGYHEEQRVSGEIYPIEMPRDIEIHVDGSNDGDSAGDQESWMDNLEDDLPVETENSGAISNNLESFVFGNATTINHTLNLTNFTMGTAEILSNESYIFGFGGSGTLGSGSFVLDNEASQTISNVLGVEHLAAQFEGLDTLWHCESFHGMFMIVDDFQPFVERMHRAVSSWVAEQNATTEPETFDPITPSHTSIISWLASSTSIFVVFTLINATHPGPNVGNVFFSTVGAPLSYTVTQIAELAALESRTGLAAVPVEANASGSWTKSMSWISFTPFVIPENDPEAVSLELAFLTWPNSDLEAPLQMPLPDDLIHLSLLHVLGKNRPWMELLLNIRDGVVVVATSGSHVEAHLQPPEPWSVIAIPTFNAPKPGVYRLLGINGLPYSHKEPHTARLYSLIIGLETGDLGAVLAAWDTYGDVDRMSQSNLHESPEEGVQVLLSDRFLDRSACIDASEPEDNINPEYDGPEDDGLGWLEDKDLDCDFSMEDRLVGELELDQIQDWVPLHEKLATSVRLGAAR